MVAPIRFLSGRQQQQKIGVQGSTENQKVLEVIGRVGIGSTIFDPSVDLDVRGDVNITGNLTIGDQQGAALSAESLSISGFSTFVGHSTFQSGMTVSGVSTFVGFTTFQNDVNIDTDLSVAGIITASQLNITGDGGQGGGAEIDNLKVSGIATFIGIATYAAGIQVFSGVSTFNDSVDIDAGLDVDGHTELDNLNVSGVSTFQNKVHLLDDDELHFGGSVGGNGDTTIVHDESNTTIAHTGEGNLQVKVAAGKTFAISKFADSDKIAEFDVDGAVRFYYDGSEKLSTTSIGASVSNGAASTATLSGPGTLIIDPAPVGDNGGILRIKGDLYVDGTQTTVNSTTVEIADKVIGIATTCTSDLLTDGAGIGIGSDKTLLYEFNSGNDPSLKSSENLNVASGKVYQIAETERLSADTLSLGTGTTIHAFDSNILTFGTNDQERIRIDANGNVGVGTDNPSGISSVTNTTIFNAGIVTAVRYFGSGGDLEDLIKEKLEGISTKFVDSAGVSTDLGNDLEVAFLTIDNSNASVGYVTAVGFGSTSVYYFNDVTAVGLTSDASIDTSGIITASSLNSVSGLVTNLSVSGVLTTSSIFGSPIFENGLSVNGISTLGNVTAGVLTAGTFLGDGSGLTGLSGVAAGVTVTNNDVTVGTAAVLNFGPDINVSAISSGIVTFSLDESQNFSGIVTITDADITNANIGVATVSSLGGINTLGIGTIFEIKSDNTDNGRFFIESSLGEIFVITNSLVAGSLFSVNDSLGVPLVDVENSSVLLAPFGGTKLVGVGTTTPESKFNVLGDSILNGNVNITGISTFENDVKIGTGGVTAFFDVSTGSVGIGTTNSTDKLQVEGSASVARFVGNRTDALGPRLSLAKSRGSTSGSATIVQDGDEIGQIMFKGADGTDVDSTGAAIIARVDGTPGTNDMPGALTFLTTNDGDNSPTERLRVSSDGKVGVGTTNPSEKLDVNGDIRLRGAIYDSLNNTGSSNQILVSNAGAGVTWSNFSAIPAGDATTLNGLSSNQFLRSDIADAKTGVTTFNNDVNVGSAITFGSLSGIVSATSFHGDGTNLTNTGASLFNTSGVQRLVLTSLTSGTMVSAATTGLLVYDGTNDRLGVGTTNPQAKLHVVDEFIVSTAGAASTQRISERAYTTDNGTLSWEASAGQLFSISNNLTSGSIFSVNDVSGIPSIDVNADGTIQLAPFGATEKVGIGTTNPQAKLDVSGDSILSNVNITGIATFQNDVKIGTGATTAFFDISTGRIGIGTTVPTTALHVIGEVTATDYNSTSDIRLKTNIRPIENPLEKVSQIGGVSFNWIENDKASMGVIADEIEKVLPQLVSDTDPKTVNYNGLIGLLIECVKQQQVEIEGLKRKIG